MPKPAAESVRVCLQDLDHAANAGVLQPGQVAPLWEYLSAHGPAAVGGVPPVPEPAHAPAGPTFDLSQTCTDSMRGSGAETVAIWVNGMCAP